MLRINEKVLIIWLDCIRDGTDYDDPCYAESGYCEDAAGIQRDLTDDELIELSETYADNIYLYCEEQLMHDADWVYDMQLEAGE